MTSLILEARKTPYQDFIFLCLGDDISRILERNLVKQPWFTLTQPSRVVGVGVR